MKYLNLEALGAQAEFTRGVSNLEYDPRFLALQQAAVEKPEQQFGDTIIAAQAPDWGWVAKQAEELLHETMDLRVALLYTWARLETHGLASYLQGLELMLYWFQEHWEQVYPPLWQDGEVDPFPRMNAVVAFLDFQGIVKALRLQVLWQDQHHVLTLRDAEQVIEQGKDGLFPGGRLRLQELLKQAQQDSTSAAAVVVRIEQRVEQLRELLQQQVGAEWMPDLAPLLQLLATFTRFYHTSAVVPEPSLSQNQQPAFGATPPVETGLLVEPLLTEPDWRAVVVHNRADALLMLEKVCSYFETHEPSHPAPYLIKRVQETVPMSFPEILENLMPSGVDQFAMWMPKSS